MDLLTQSPGTHNAFDPLLMVFGMLTEILKKRREKAFPGRNDSVVAVTIILEPTKNDKLFSVAATAFCSVNKG